MISVPHEVWVATTAQLRNCTGGAECVVYWLGPANDPGRVDAVIHPQHRASPWSYTIDDKWLTEFGFSLGKRMQSARVQVHTHRDAAFHSETDDAWPLVGQPGFLSLVLPRLASDDHLPQDAYLAELHDDGWAQRLPSDFLEFLG